MQKTIEINADVYKELKKTSLFFVKFLERTYTDERGRVYDNSEWKSVDRNLDISFQATGFGEQTLGYCLCILDKVEAVLDSDGNINQDKVNIYIHEAIATSATDCTVILNNYIARCNDRQDKYAFVKLLWFLDKKGIDETTLKYAIGNFDERTVPFVLNLLRRICRSLSINKQKVIKSVYESFSSRYDIYMPEIITEALKLCEISCDKENLNLFELVDKIIGIDEVNPSLEVDSENLLLHLQDWLTHSNMQFNDYKKLISLFSVVAEPIRLKIVKRYFHDIRFGYTTFDPDLVSQFKDNQFDEFIRFRYATEMPSERVVLTVPLLCDIILTLYNSKGKTFQTFDGVLDFAITHCDIAHPAVDFKLDRFIPTCHNAAVYNASSFKGFIDYQLIRKFTKENLTIPFLHRCIVNILDTYGERLKYPVCKYGPDSKIDDNQFARCSQVFKSHKEKDTYSLECYTYKRYKDKWKLKKTDENINILESLIASNVEIKEEEGYMLVDINMLSFGVFRNYILSLFSHYDYIDNDEYLFSSSKMGKYEFMLINWCSDIVKMRIFPQEGAFVGHKFDVFGLWKEISSALTPEQLINKNSSQYIAAYEEYISKEIVEVYLRTIESLRKELGEQCYNGAYFELPYSKSTIETIVNKYYFKESFNNKDNVLDRQFLVSSTNTENFKQFCAPKLSEINNQAINIPYFWCRGRECFRNNLNEQTLATTDDWQKYSLYHLAEIIGYPKLHSTIAGNEPDPVVWNFIAIANKAMRKFSRLKCRVCGHMMFPDKGGGYNRYNYFSCINPTCSEAGNTIYLNFCYKCKRTLIDSRDTKKCPNGWYICPICLSCCDDELYERQAQLYILSNRPIPYRINKMIGHGHNDKGEYFCPICGSKLESVIDEHGHEVRCCPLGHKEYEVIPDMAFDL